jgi:hypothetical protein
LASAGQFVQTNKAILEAPYCIAVYTAECEKPRKITEGVKKPCPVKGVKLFLGTNMLKMYQISFSNCTMKGCISEIRKDMLNQIYEIQSHFALHLIKPTDVTSCEQLLECGQHISIDCEGRIPVSLSLNTLQNIFISNGLQWTELVSMHTIGAL